MFHKIRALHAAGVIVHLHCFDYGRGRQPELDRYCAEVDYYKRMEGHKGVSMKLPYIVTSRANPLLLENLKKDDHPILFEGIHTTYFLHTGDLDGRKCFVRMHNLEHDYYKQLADNCRSLLKKFYCLFESRLLLSYERSLSGKAVFLAISDRDAASYRMLAPGSDVRPLPAFTGWAFPLCKEGLGNFCLYHGNLSIPENEKSVVWLLKEVFNDLKIPFVVAGKKPSAFLQRLAHKKQHTCIVADPSDKELQDLIQKAQIHILPSFSTTGVKFKLLNAVFCGRHVIGNEKMLKGTHLEAACHEAGSAGAFKSLIMQLFRKSFDDEEISLRENMMNMYYNSESDARRLISWIW